MEQTTSAWTSKRRIVHKYCIASNNIMVHRYGRPYIPEQQHAPRQPAFWLPALSHPSRSQIIRSGDIMHTLLRRLSLFNATPDFSVLNYRFLSWIGRRCCSISIATQLHSRLEYHIERRIASGSQYVLCPHTAKTAFPCSFVVNGSTSSGCDLSGQSRSSSVRPMMA